MFFVAAFFFDFGVGLYFFLFNLFLLNLRFDERAMGIIAGALTMGNVVGTIPVGIVARRIGLQKLLLFCFIAAPAHFHLPHRVRSGCRRRSVLRFLRELH